MTYGARTAVLGLVLGLFFASLREIIRPTIAQPSAGARELGTIPLGNATVAGDLITGIDDDICGCLSLTAQRAGASTIVLTGPCSRARLAALADTLNRDLPGGRPGRESAVTIGNGHPVGLHEPRPRIRVVALPDIISG